MCNYCLWINKFRQNFYNDGRQEKSRNGRTLAKMLEIYIPGNSKIERFFLKVTAFGSIGNL
jgi:hypothetical protein